MPNKLKKNYHAKTRKNVECESLVGRGNINVDLEALLSTRNYGLGRIWKF